MPQTMLVKYAKRKGEGRVTELCAQIMTYGVDAGPPTRSPEVHKVEPPVVRNALKE